MARPRAEEKTMQYMLLIYEPKEAYREPSALQEVVAAHMRVAADMREKGVMVAGDGLQNDDTATTVRMKDGQQVLHDGPFPETREQLGGYYLIDVPDLDAALAWARQVPIAEGGGVEVRPLIVY
jgi:hypothetical protein